MTGQGPRLVQAIRNGPILVAGPVRIETTERVVESDRFMVAICACGRSRTYPLCDTSHRRCSGNQRQIPAAQGDGAGTAAAESS